MSLFEESLPPKPLAERMRPRSLQDILGQNTAVALLNAFVDRGEMPSVVFHGPPGSGKTTMSRLMAAMLGWEGRSLNATSASVKDIRALASEAKEMWKQLEKRTLLFIDEIHRLNKGQQDVLLPFVEAGTLTLAGSTTENPYFALNQALLSRIQLIRLEPLSPEVIKNGLERICRNEKIKVNDEALIWISERVAGDLRLGITVLESAGLMAASKDCPIGLDDVRVCLSQTQIAGDRNGDNHYDLASAFQKSLRGSDPNAAIYYLARFLETGEDPRFIARRLMVTASEDVGNADPQALLVAGQAFRATEIIGMPECRIHLAQATLYVARAHKSNEAIASLGRAVSFLKSRPLDQIPPNLRDSHYLGASDLGHGKGYVNSHKDPNFNQFFLPESIADQSFISQPAVKAGKADKLEDQALDQLVAILKKGHGEEPWFEINPEKVASRMDWPLDRVRAGLNQLVQSKRLSYKRQFSFE